MSTDAIVLLKEDHKGIRKLFRDFQNAGEKAIVQKTTIVEKIIEALTVHTYIENECMYPAIRELLPGIEGYSGGSCGSCKTTVELRGCASDQDR